MQSFRRLSSVRPLSPRTLEYVTYDMNYNLCTSARSPSYLIPNTSSTKFTLQEHPRVSLLTPFVPNILSHTCVCFPLRTGGVGYF
jgi:hypothetical protein